LKNKNLLKGYQRDKRIIEEIEKRKILTTSQVHKLFFNNQSSGLRIAQRRLQKLSEQGKILKNRISFDGNSIYSTDKINPSEHLLMSNWVYVYLKKTLPSWEEITKYDYEQDYGILRCDSFCTIRNTKTDKHRFYFIEVDLSNNEFDKVLKYNELYKSNGYTNWWWVKLADKFPRILITTHRKKHVLERIEKENNGLLFEVLALNELYV